MSLVLELQEGIYNNKYQPAEILRKAYVISRKLEIGSISVWLNSEMNGYKNKEYVPDYRKISGIYKGLNPYYGWHPIDMNSFSEVDLKEITLLKIDSSVRELESLVKESGDKVISLKNGWTDYLMSELETSVRIDIVSCQIEGILENVKNKVLDWTLNLENEGVLGEGMTFSKEEKEKAMNITINGANNSPIQIQTNNSTQEVSYKMTREDLKIIIDKINEVEETLNKSSKLSDDLKLDLDSVKLQLNKEKPNKSLVKNMLTSIKIGIAGIPKAVNAIESIMGYFG